MPPAVVGVIAAALLLQVTTPFKKSDLVRLLSSSLDRAEIADLVQRRCVSFTPSARDRADLRALGADDQVLQRVDECARKNAPLQATARLREAVVLAGGRAAVMVEVRRGNEPAPAVRVVLRGSSRMTGGPDAELLTDVAGRARFDIAAGQTAGTFRLTVTHAEGAAFKGAVPLDVTVRPAPLVATSARTGFVAGTGQRGRVGTRLPLPLVFEARDTANRPVPGLALTLVGSNARVEPAAGVTDSGGRVRAFVILGQRAGPADVVATLGRIERHAPLVALPGPPARVVLRCGGAEITTPLALSAGADHELVVRVHDALGNEVPLTDLRVVAADRGTVRPAAAIDMIVLHAVQAGRTDVVVEASGVRRTIATAVGQREGATAGCRRGVPGG